MISARDAFVDTAAFSRARAKPLPPDARRDAILDAVIPLIRAHGRSVSSRQMAEAAGVAEGTLFRAFGDKDSIISAATERFLDPEPFRASLRAIDPAAPTDAKVRAVLHALRERFAGVIGFMSAIGMHGPPRHDDRFHRQDWLELLDPLFGPGELAISTRDLGFSLRLLAFGSAIPLFNEPHPFDDDELAELVLRGVLPRS